MKLADSSQTGQGISLRQRRIILAFFAVVILFSMMRDCSAPRTCLRYILSGPAASRIR
jgi:hypothetical protein